MGRGLQTWETPSSSIVPRTGKTGGAARGAKGVNLLPRKHQTAITQKGEPAGFYQNKDRKVGPNRKKEPGKKKKGEETSSLRKSGSPFGKKNHSTDDVKEGIIFL